jgi:hypothetical protein
MSVEASDAMVEAGAGAQQCLALVISDDVAAKNLAKKGEAEASQKLDKQNYRKICGSLKLGKQNYRKINGSLKLSKQKYRKIRGNLRLGMQKYRKMHGILRLGMQK